MKSRRAAQRRPPKRPLSARCPKILFMLVIMQFGVLSYMMFATPATGVDPGSEPQAQQVEELRREKQRLEATNTKLAAQVSADRHHNQPLRVLHTDSIRLLVTKLWADGSMDGAVARASSKDGLREPQRRVSRTLMVGGSGGWGSPKTY